MRIRSALVPRLSRLARLGTKLSKETRKRLKWFDFYERHGHNARLMYWYFGKAG